MPLPCTSCRSLNPDSAKFCAECGKPLTNACPSCGAPAGGGKFCAECGTPLAEIAPAPQHPRLSGPEPVSERRTTTVLFGDLVSFTTLSESRDPEEVRELLSAYFAVARTVVGRYGGTIEKFIGDAVMAVWGVPVSHEDDAERAVRAGLDLVSEVAALGVSVGAPELSMRVGIVTGSVAVTLGAVNEGMVAGDAVNTAARVQTAADPGTVWVDSSTRGLTERVVAFTDMGEHVLKGKAEPARLHRADMVVASMGGAQRVDGLQAPMCGRDPDLLMVKELFHRTQVDGRARLVLVTGIAGIGKSRLGWEFEKHVDGLTDGHYWHRGRCLSYGDGVAFWAFADMIRSRLGILETADRADIDDKVRTGVEAVAATPDEATWLVPRVAALVSGDQTVVFERNDLFAAWTTFLERVGGDRPVALLFEDVQHADSGLLDFIEHLLQTTRAKLFVVLFTRPDLLMARPTLPTGRHATVVALEPLADDVVGSLLDGLVADLPPQARMALVSRAEGVPLYAVETVRSLIDHDAVIARDGRYVFVDHDHSRVDLHSLSAPTSLQTLIAARLDTLKPLERRIVQDASVLGLTFRYPTLLAVAEVSSYELDLALDALVEKGILDTQNDPRSPELGQFRFLQAMVREVAYSTLGRNDRKARHVAAARHLELEGSDSVDALSGIIAQHLLDALSATSERDPERAAMTARARTLLTTSAARAEALGSPEESLRSALAALDLSPDPLERTQLQERAGRAATLAGQLALGAELAAQAVAGHRTHQDPVGVARSLAVQAKAAMSLGRIAEAIELATEGDDLATRRDDIPAQVHLRLLFVLSRCARGLGDTGEQRRQTVRLGRIAEQLQDPAATMLGLNNVALMLNDAGSRTAASAVVERCIVLAREGHVLDQLSRSLSNLCSEAYPRDLARADELAVEAVEVARQVGDTYLTDFALANACSTWVLSGHWDRLIDQTSDWIEGSEEAVMAGPQWLARAQVQLARGQQVTAPEMLTSEDPFQQYCADLLEGLRLVGRGEVAEGAAHVAPRALEQFRLDGVEDFEVMWGPTVDLLLRAGDLDSVGELVDLAVPRLTANASPLTRGVVPRFRGLLALARGEDPESHLREAEAALTPYAAPYLLARTRLELGRWLHQQGRTDEAAPLLALARPVFEQLGAEPSLAELDDLEPVATLAVL